MDQPKKRINVIFCAWGLCALTILFGNTALAEFSGEYACFKYASTTYVMPLKQNKSSSFTAMTFILEKIASFFKNTPGTSVHDVVRNMLASPFPQKTESDISVSYFGPLELYKTSIHPQGANVLQVFAQKMNEKFFDPTNREIELDMKIVISPIYRYRKDEENLLEGLLEEDPLSRSSLKKRRQTISLFFKERNEKPNLTNIPSCKTYESIEILERIPEKELLEKGKEFLSYEECSLHESQLKRAFISWILDARPQEEAQNSSLIHSQEILKYVNNDSNSTSQCTITLRPVIQDTQEDDVGILNAVSAHEHENRNTPGFVYVPELKKSLSLPASERKQPDKSAKKSLNASAHKSLTQTSKLPYIPNALPRQPSLKTPLKQKTEKEKGHGKVTAGAKGTMQKATTQKEEKSVFFPARLFLHREED